MRGNIFLIRFFCGRLLDSGLNDARLVKERVHATQ